MLLLEINPIVGFMANYLYLVVLHYRGWISPFQASNWMTFSKVQLCSVCS